MSDVANQRPRRTRRGVNLAVEGIEDRLLLSSGITTFPTDAPLGGNRPTAIIKGPDGDLWFTGSDGDIGRITPSGQSTIFRLPGDNGSPYTGYVGGLTVGADGNVWFSVSGALGKITHDGTVTEIPVPGGFSPGALTADHAGNLWFIEDGDHIGRYSPDGAFQQFALPNPQHQSNPDSIVVGPDGNIWFSREYHSSRGSSVMIDRITPDGAVTEFRVATGWGNVDSLTTGPDGNLWFTEDVNGQYDVGRLSTQGAVTTYVISNWSEGITSGPDGALWYTSPNTGQVGRITTNGQITTYTVAQPGPSSTPVAITTGPDGALWYTLGFPTAIGRLDPNLATPDQPAGPTVPSSVTPSQPSSGTGVNQAPTNPVSGDTKLMALPGGSVFTITPSSQEALTKKGHSLSSAASVSHERHRPRPTPPRIRPSVAHHHVRSRML